MASLNPVAARPVRPVLVYDGSCEFCCRAVQRCRQRLGEGMEFLAAHSGAVATWFPEIPRERFSESVVLIETDGRTYAGAEAMVRVWAHARGRGWALRAYQFVPGLARAAEWVYRQVAARRRCGVKPPAM